MNNTSKPPLANVSEGFMYKITSKRFVSVKIAACRLVSKTLERHGSF